jgi:DNA-binding CsgD family transcriptional regulator
LTSGFRIDSFSFLGFGLLPAWVSCTFFVGDFSPVIRNLGNASGMQGWVTSTIAVIGGLLLLVLFRRHLGLLSRRPLLCIVAVLCTASGTLGIALEPVFYRIGGGVLTGIGTACLWVMWAEIFSRLDADTVERTVLASAMASTLVIAAIALVPSAMRAWAVALLPIISGMCFALSIRFLNRQAPDTSKTAALQEDRSILAWRKSAGFGLFFLRFGVPCLLIFALWPFYIHSAIPGSAPFGFSFVAFPLGFIIYLVMLVLFYRYASSMSALSILLWTAPLVIVVIAVLGLQKEALLLVGCSFLVSALMTLDQFGWILFTRIYRADPGDPIRVFGLLRLFYQVFIFCGSLVGYLLFTGVLDGYYTLTTCALLLLAGFAVYCCLVLGAAARRTSTFGEKVHSIAPDTREHAQDDPAARRASRQEEAYLALAKRIGLSEREREVYLMLMRGRNVPYIRDELIISRNTVNTHVKHIYAKAGVHSRQELIDLAESGDADSGLPV